MKFKYFIIALPILAFVLSASPIVHIKEASAAPGDVRVTVTRQGDDGFLEGALVEIKCADGAYTPFAGSPLTDVNGQVTGTPQAASNCDQDDESLNAQVSLTGYATKNTESGILFSWNSGMDPNEISVSGVEFGLAIVVADELGTAIDTLDTITFRGNAASLQDAVETNKFYWIDTSGANGAIVIEKDGYVSFSTTNPLDLTLVTTSTAEQVLITLGNAGACNTGIAASTSCLGLQFGYIYPRIQNELGTNLSGVTLSAGQAGVSCTEGASGWYCPITTGDAIPDRYSFTKDGYVGRTFVGGAFGGNRTLNTDPQVDLGTIGSVQFSHKFITKDELGNNLTLTSATAGASSVACTISTNNVYCPILLADDNTLSNGLVGIKDGYVTTTASAVPLAGDRTLGTTVQQVTTMTTTNGLDFSHKLTGIKDELGNNITPTSAIGGSNNVSCSMSGNVIYCPIQLAHDDAGGYTIVKEGYQTVEPSLAGNRTSNTDAQVSSAIDLESYAFKFSHRVYVKNELNVDLTPDSVSAGANNTVCTIDGFTAYCPIPAADDDDLTDGFVIVTDGYVTADVDLIYNRADNGDTTEDSRVQMDASNGLDFAVKTTVTKASDSSALSGATVTTGDLLAVSCAENGVTGIYYCAVPLAHTANEVNVTKSGYTSNAGTFTDRTLSTDPQRTVSIALSVPVVSSGGGGGVVPQVSCSSVTYGEWQNSCVNGIQYRNIFSETGCAITAAQRSAAQRSCTNESISETSQTPSSGSSLIAQVTALEKTLTETINTILTNSLLGRILLQVENHGESWYLNPIDSSRYFMGRPLDAFNLMKRFALGVNNADMQEFLLRGAPRRLSGRIVMNVDDKGKAYYVNPLNLKLYYLGNPDNAFSIMKSFGLGISNIHLRQIKVGEL